MVILSALMISSSLLFILSLILEIHHERDAERILREQHLGVIRAVGVQPEVGCLETNVMPVLPTFAKFLKRHISITKKCDRTRYHVYIKKFLRSVQDGPSGQGQPFVDNEISKSCA